MICTIEVTVEGFESDPVLVSHKTRSKAFAEAWNLYRCYDESCTFKKFMQIAKRRSVPNPDGVGVPVMVLGNKGYTIEPLGKNTTRFIYENGDTILTAHENDIDEIEES